MPLVEPQVAHHLLPAPGSVGLPSTAPKLAPKVDRLTPSLCEKAYRASAQAGSSVNTSTMLVAYLSALEEDRSHGGGEPHGAGLGRFPDRDGPHPQGVPMHHTGDGTLHRLDCDRSKEPMAWPDVPDKEKGAVLDYPVATEGLFGVKAIAMLQEPPLKGQGIPTFKHTVVPQPQRHRPVHRWLPALYATPCFSHGASSGQHGTHQERAATPEPAARPKAWARHLFVPTVVQTQTAAHPATRGKTVRKLHTGVKLGCTLRLGHRQSQP